MSDESFAAAIARVAEAAALVDRTLDPGDRVTQFEVLTAAAYWELARAGVEVAAVEAGLGGRYDATSVIRSSVQVLTNVSLEHTRWLGPTETHIAEEKLAVVPAGGTLVAGRLGPEALEVDRRVVAEQDAQLLLMGRDFGRSRSGAAPARRLPAGELRRRRGRRAGLPRSRSTPGACAPRPGRSALPAASRWWTGSRSRSWTARTTRPALPRSRERSVTWWRGAARWE